MSSGINHLSDWLTFTGLIFRRKRARISQADMESGVPRDLFIWTITDRAFCPVSN
jgi:hypothetical protein